MSDIKVSVLHDCIIKWLEVNNQISIALCGDTILELRVTDVENFKYEKTTFLTDICVKLMDEKMLSKNSAKNKKNAENIVELVEMFEERLNESFS